MKNFLKKIVLISFTFALFANLSVAKAASFDDVAKDHPNYDAIEYLKDKGVVSGYEDGTFKPEDPINRAAAAKIIDTAFNINTTKEYSEFFSDVKKSNWFFPYVMAGKEAGFINGYGDGTFLPNKQVKLSETLKMVLSAAKVNVSKKVTSNVFVDVQKNDWVAQYALYARDHNVVMSDENGKIYPNTVMTRGTFSEIVYRTMIVLDNHEKAFPIYNNWTNYEGTDLPFEIKYDPEMWEVVKGSHDILFFNSDEVHHQFSPVRMYPNSAKVEITIDQNEEKLVYPAYFNNIKESFPDAEYKEFKWNNFNSLEVLYPEEKIVDWYVYLDSKYVMVVYTQYGDGPESYRFPNIIKAMLDTLEYNDIEINFTEDYEKILSTIFENILIEDKGMDMLDLLPDKIVIETDSIGVGTGPVDYYYSKGVNYTFKYERESDVILDKRQGQTSAF
jgi:hypothetical protein